MPKLVMDIDVGLWFGFRISMCCSKVTSQLMHFQTPIIISMCSHML
jgi:hypothetical protein